MTNCCYQSSDRILRTKRNLFLIKTKEERWTHVAHRGYFSCLSKTVFTRSTKLPPIHKYYKGMCYSQIYMRWRSLLISSWCLFHVLYFVAFYRFIFISWHNDALWSLNTRLSGSFETFCWTSIKTYMYIVMTIPFL